MSYACYAAAVEQETPFKLYSQCSFGSDLSALSEHDECAQRRAASAALHRRSNTLAVASLLVLATLMAGAFTYAPPGPRGVPAPWSGAAAMVAAKAAPPVQAAPPAPAAVGAISCTTRVQQGGAGAVSSLCDGELELLDGRTQHITIWRSSERRASEQLLLAGAGLARGRPTLAAAGSDAAAGWAAAGRRRLRQRPPRKLLQVQPRA